VADSFKSVIRFSHRSVCCAIRVSLLHSPIRVLPHSCAVRVQYVLLATCVLNSLHAVLLYSLDRAISEDALFLSVRKNALDCSVGEYDFFGAVREMFLNLLVWKFEHLQAIWKSGLGGFGLCEVVNYFLIWICLFYIIVIEIHYCVPVRVRFSPYSIRKNDLFLPIYKGPLNFTVVANYLLLNCGVIMVCCAMVLRRELHLIVLFVVTFFCFCRLFLFWFQALILIHKTTHRGVFLDVDISLFFIH